MSLVSTIHSPVPEDTISGYVETPDQIKIRYARWSASKRPCKGTVLVLHGRAEYIEKLLETTDFLRQSGFDVCTFDWRGQGGSSRMLKDPQRGYVDHFDNYITDLDTIVEQVALPDCVGPLYVLGHSTGALVALLAAARYSNRFKRMVLCAPLLGLNQLPLSASKLKWITGTLTLLGLGELYLGGGKNLHEARTFLGNNLTHDLDRFNRNREFALANPHLAIAGPTVGWFYAALCAMEKIKQVSVFSKITIPTLLVSASGDQVVDPHAVEWLSARLRSGSHLSIAGAKHELLHESDIYREQLLSAFDAFIPGSDITSPPSAR